MNVREFLSLSGFLTDYRFSLPKVFCLKVQNPTHFIILCFSLKSTYNVSYISCAKNSYNLVLYDYFPPFLLLFLNINR